MLAYNLSEIQTIYELFCILIKIKGTKSQDCCYCDKFKLVNKFSLSISLLI